MFVQTIDNIRRISDTYERWDDAASLMEARCARTDAQQVFLLLLFFHGWPLTIFFFLCMFHASSPSQIKEEEEEENPTTPTYGGDAERVFLFE